MHVKFVNAQISPSGVMWKLREGVPELGCHPRHLDAQLLFLRRNLKCTCEVLLCFEVIYSRSSYIKRDAKLLLRKTILRPVPTRDVLRLREALDSFAKLSREQDEAPGSVGAYLKMSLFLTFASETWNLSEANIGPFVRERS
ncbi:hypothetical protein TNCV_2377361 [Trichonephila clavipes]|nr:hypothetical protein TNCV_2377361 [Trichonephila clavipes]